MFRFRWLCGDILMGYPTQAAADRARDARLDALLMQKRDDGARMPTVDRKSFPLASGLLDYFPDACAAVANSSLVGNDQHSPGQTIRWDRSKSQDEADCLLRHLVDRGTVDTDGVRHSAKVAWRALALLQKEIEAERGLGISRGSYAGD